jgi:hypothetical protein
MLRMLPPPARRICGTAERLILTTLSKFCSTARSYAASIEIEAWAERRRAVIVDKDVDPAETGDGIRDDALAISRLADIALDCEDVAAGLVEPMAGDRLEDNLNPGGRL